MQLAILGRQHKISLAELEALYGSSMVTPISDYACLVQSDSVLPQSRLGGTIKSARVLTRLPSTDLTEAYIYLQNTIPEHLVQLPDGKLQLGVSVYGFSASRDWLLKQTLRLKKVIKSSGRSVRIIENKTEALDAAQVLYNKLTGPLGWELLLVKDGKDVVLAQTTEVQDIDAYAQRDHGRPMRDAKVGMLPPKLAQIMINLGLASHNPASTQLLDAFCGTGVVLQEALLMRCLVNGSDLSERMIDYTNQNLKWLKNSTTFTGSIGSVEVADATTHKWPYAGDLQAVVSETYLGKPLTSLPTQQTLGTIMSEADQIAFNFFENIGQQIRPGTRLCLALPAWKTTQGFQHLKTLEKLASLGYNRLEFVHANNRELIYHRENQIVARELTVLEKS